MRRGDKLETVWERPAHTKAKHDILVKYLQAWFAIFGESPHVSKAIVMDGFAGPGVYDGGEPGSPVLVLEALLGHARFATWNGTEFIFVFNEADQPRYASLTTVLDGIVAANQPWPKNVTVAHDNQMFSAHAEELLGSIGEGRRMAPIFAFIDPFGYKDTTLDLIRRLLQYPKAELFIYFDFNSVNRFAGKGVGVDERFVDLFGCDDFYDAPAAGPQRGKFLHDLYERQLKTVCSFAHVQSFAMVNDAGRVGNYLFFCTRNLEAFDKMKAVMWKLDPSGEYRFEDRFANQDVLFDDAADTDLLQEVLLEQFSGERVRIDEVIEFVVRETPYYSGQVKVKTLRPMQAAGLISSPNQKRAGFYPDGTWIDFT